jgi:hypothetical protein
MIGISKKVENAVISVLTNQAELAGIEVIRGKAAVTHATFPRVMVGCKDLASLIPGNVNPYKATLELTVQTEAKVDTDGDTCEDIADVVSSALSPPNGANAVDSAFTSGKLNKLEFKLIDELRLLQDKFNFKMNAEIYLQA